MEDNCYKNNWKLAKTYESQGILEKTQGIDEKTQGILEKTQGTGGLRLTYSPKKCPNKKPGIRVKTSAVLYNKIFICMTTALKGIQPSSEVALTIKVPFL